MKRFILLLALLFGTEAHVSEGRRQVKLKEVVEAAEVIVLVKPAEPSTRKVSIPITAPGEDASKEKPPFEYVVTRWVVEEVLAGSSPLEAGQTLEVNPADLSTRKTVHRKYHLEGVRKIPLYSVYSPPEIPDSEKRRILFLEKSSDDWSLVYRGALEAPARKAKILKLLTAARTRDRIDKLPPR